MNEASRLEGTASRGVDRRGFLWARLDRLRQVEPMASPDEGQAPDDILEDVRMIAALECLANRARVGERVGHEEPVVLDPMVFMDRRIEVQQTL